MLINQDKDLEFEGLENIRSSYFDNEEYII